MNKRQQQEQRQEKQKEIAKQNRTSTITIFLNFSYEYKAYQSISSLYSLNDTEHLILRDTLMTNLWSKNSQTFGTKRLLVYLYGANPIQFI